VHNKQTRTLNRKDGFTLALSRPSWASG
jgi:hypothetical protein